jgi:hypothetical protein
VYETMLGRATALKTTRTGHCDGTWGEGQLWIARPTRGSDDKRRAPSIVNGRRSVSTFPALPARWSAEIVESNVDFSVKSPASYGQKIETTARTEGYPQVA